MSFHSKHFENLNFKIDFLWSKFYKLDQCVIDGRTLLAVLTSLCIESRINKNQLPREAARILLACVLYDRSFQTYS